MICEKIDLYNYFDIERTSVNGGYLRTYVPDAIAELNPKTRPAVLIIPGGAYKIVSERESEPVALKFAVNGYASFSLEYSVDTAYPCPLLEACMAVIYIREQADKYCVDGKHVCAVGFSAGGHLAGMLATLNDEAITNVLGERTKLAELNAVVFSYPVVTLGEHTHELTRDVITGGNSALLNKLSIEKRVNKNSVPAFIWHTAEDDAVSVQNSLILAQAYNRAEVPFALHIFEKGRHGLSLCNDETHNQTQADKELSNVSQWFGLCIDWLKTRGFCVKTVY